MVTLTASIFFCFFVWGFVESYPLQQDPAFGPGFKFANGGSSRVVSITEYPGVGHMKTYGKEYADQGLPELNQFHRLGLGVQPGNVKSTSIQTDGYDFYKVLEYLGEPTNDLAAFNNGPNILPSLGLPNAGYEGFNRIDRGSGFYGFGDPYALESFNPMPGEIGTAVGPMAMEGRLHIVQPGGHTIV